MNFQSRIYSSKKTQKQKSFEFCELEIGKDYLHAEAMQKGGADADNFVMRV